MTERQRDEVATNRPTEERKLSTADMAAAASQQQVDQRKDQAAPQAAPKTNKDQQSAELASLLGSAEIPTYRTRWSEIQTGFVDEPRHAVEQADSLVAEVMQRLAETFANERAKLEGQWSRGDNVSTEDLRVALQRYRSFFDRLLSM
jgi:hypothetical protein